MRNKRGSWERGLVSGGGVSAAPSAADSWSRPASPLGYGRPAKVATRVPSPLDMNRDGCLARLPYASLMAFAMCTVGVFIFTLMSCWSFNATVEQLRRLLNVTDIPWLDRVYVLFFIVAATMTVVTAAFLGIGALSTGSTRHEVYARGGARRAGRALCALAMALAGVLNAAWTVVAAAAAILATVYWALARVCARLPADGAASGTSSAAGSACLDFSVFRPLVSDYSEATLILCGGAVQQFCALSSTVVVWYALSAFSALLVCLGLLGFVAGAAANHAHIGGERRARQLRDILVAETTTAAPSSAGSAAGGGLNSYASAPGGRKMSASRLIPQPPADYPLDGYPTMRQPPHAYGIGTMQQPMSRAPSQSALPYYDRRPNAGGRSIGAAVGAARRNSYHNSLNDEYNDAFWARR